MRNTSFDPQVLEQHNRSPLSLHPTKEEKRVKAWDSLYPDPPKTIHDDNLCGHKDGDTVLFMLNNDGVRTGPYKAKVKLSLPIKKSK